MSRPLIAAVVLFAIGSYGLALWYSSMRRDEPHWRSMHETLTLKRVLWRH